MKWFTSLQNECSPFCALQADETRSSCQMRLHSATAEVFLTNFRALFVAADAAFMRIGWTDREEERLIVIINFTLVYTTLYHKA